MISTKMLKGAMGESVIRDKLIALQDKYAFEFIYDVPVKKSNGDYQQCDFVVLSTRGYFALEVKNWDGEVECQGCSRTYWPIYVRGRRVVVPNPILQNASHIKWLRESYGINCENIILFADTCTLLTPPLGVYNFRDLENLFALSEEYISPMQVAKDFRKMSSAKAENALRATAERFVKHYSKEGW